MALGRTAKYYRDNPEARKKRLAYQKRYNARKAQIARRVKIIEKIENLVHTATEIRKMYLIKAEELF